MRDIEDSFEEKYNKLRSIAVRLKKKISEQTKRIEELESSLSTAGTDSPDSIAKTTIDAPTRNLQQLQKQNDALQDELEATRATDKQNAALSESLSKKLAEANNELAAMKMVNENIKTSAETSSSQKSTLDQAVKEYVKQIATLKDELAAVRKEHQVVNGDCTQLKGIR